MRSYVIYLKNYDDNYIREGAEKQEGYVSDIGLAIGQLSVCAELDQAVHYPTRELAEQALLDFEEKFGLDREEANITDALYSTEYELELGDMTGLVGISVSVDGSRRLITVRNGGFEASDEIPQEVAELLVPVQIKIEKRLDGGNKADPAKETK